MNRRNFLRTVSITTAALAFPHGNFAFINENKNFTFKEIRGGVGFYTNRGGTIGWLNTKDALVIIDSQFPDTVKICRSELLKTAVRNIDLLFNTHHHRDHTSGNPYLSGFTKTIVAHKNCVRLQKEKNSGGKTKIVTANVTFDKDWTLSVGNEKLSAYHLTNAHTGGDAVLHFENSNVVHMGDLVFNGVYPWVNKSDEASLSGWIKFLDDAIHKYDNDAVFIFGHSYDSEHVIGKKKDLFNMRNYIEALLDFTRNQIKIGKSDEEILRTEFIPGFIQLQPLWDGALAKNIEAALIELKNK